MDTSFQENVKLSIKRHKIWTQIVSELSRLGLEENYPKKTIDSRKFSKLSKKNDHLVNIMHLLVTIYIKSLDNLD